MPVDMNTVSERLTVLGFPGNVKLANYVYDSLRNFYRNSEGAISSINGMVNISEPDVYRIVKTYSELRKSIDQSACELFSIDAQYMLFSRELLADLLERTYRGERFIILITNLDENVFFQADLLEFLSSYLVPRERMEFFYTAKDMEALDINLKAKTAKCLDNSVLYCSTEKEHTN